MATTLQNFVKMVSAALVGSTVQAAGAVVAVNPANGVQMVAGGGATNIDKVSVDLARSSYAKNGAAVGTLSGTTPVTIDFTDITSGTSGTTAWAGDTTFATLNQLVLTNTGAADFTLAPGGSNPSRFPTFSGTTPTITVPAGASLTLAAVTGLTVDSTHKTLTITPTSGGSFALAVGGA